MKTWCMAFLTCFMFSTSVCAMKKEIEIKFTLEQAKRVEFEKWLKDHAMFKGIEHHEEVYLNNPKKSFFFDHEQGFKDAHTTIRLRHKKITTPAQETDEKEFFCTKFCHVDEFNRIVSRDEFEVDLSADNARESLTAWMKENFKDSLLRLIRLTKENVLLFFEIHGLTEQFQLTKERALYRFGDLEIALDTLPGIGSFIEVELKSDEQDVATGTQQIHEFLKKAGITQFIQYDRSYLHMKINPEYNFGREMNLQEISSNDKE